MQLKKRVIPWLFILPALITITWLKYYPITKAFFMSLFDYSIVNPPGNFVGLENYKTLFSVGLFWQAWKNTFLFLLYTLIISFLPPLIQAIFLNEVLRFNKLFRIIYLIPSVIPISVFAILWKWIWKPEYGLANVVTKSLGLGEFMWLNDPNLAKICLVFPGIVGGGIAVFVYLSAIQGIPDEIYEAAIIDGASAWKKIFHIVLPNLTFVILIQLVFTVISVLQIMDAPFQMTSGGPTNSTTSVALIVYQYAQKNMEYGLATAASFVLMIVILIITVVQVVMNKAEAN